jgi:hypothetical protein
MFLNYLHSIASYAASPIYPPEILTCDGKICKEVDKETFKIVIPNTQGTFFFDYAYADPRPQGGFVFVYVYRKQNSKSFANSLETLYKSGFDSLPDPQSNWSRENNPQCKGKCGFINNPKISQ